MIDSVSQPSGDVSLFVTPGSMLLSRSCVNCVRPFHVCLVILVASSMASWMFVVCVSSWLIVSMVSLLRGGPA